MFRPLNIMELPEELIREIMQHLPQTDLARLNRTCRKIYRIGDEDRLWQKKGLFKRTAETAFAGNDIKIPPSRLCHSATTFNGKIYIFGGHNVELNSQRFSEVKNDLYTYEPMTNAWEKNAISCMPNKTEHSTVLHDNQLYVYGGYSGTVFSTSLYRINLDKQICELVDATGEIPLGRSAHIGIACENKMYVFGGWNGVDQNNHFFSFNFDTSQWTKITSDKSPPPRCSHTATCSNQNIYIFGGYGGKTKGYLNDLWSFNTMTSTWTELPARGAVPSPRSRMRVIEWEGKLILYGGWDKVEHFDELYQYDLKNGMWTKTDIGERREAFKIGQHSMSIIDNILYIFGGYSSEAKWSTNNMYAYRLGKSKDTPILVNRKNVFDCKMSDLNKREHKITKYDLSSEV